LCSCQLPQAAIKKKYFRFSVALTITYILCFQSRQSLILFFSQNKMLILFVFFSIVQTVFFFRFALLLLLSLMQLHFSIIVKNYFQAFFLCCSYCLVWTMKLLLSLVVFSSFCFCFFFQLYSF
jgi:hypothetical protein